jgi:hypothetical protein
VPDSWGSRAAPPREGPVRIRPRGGKDQLNRLILPIDADGHDITRAIGAPARHNSLDADVDRAYRTE